MIQTVQEKKAYLKDFRKLGLEIDRMIEEYERLYSWATRMTPTLSTGFSRVVPGSHGSEDRVCGSVERLICINEEINRRIGEYIDRREEIHAAIDSLEDGTLRTLMGLYYLNGLTWGEVAERMGYEIRTITRLHGVALEQIETT